MLPDMLVTVTSSGFPWETLITAAGPLAGALGAVWIKGRQDAKRDTGRAVQVRQDAREDEQRDAYAGLVVAARAVLRNQRQIKHLYSINAIQDQAAQRIRDRGNELIDALTQAVAVVQLVGSPGARYGADEIYEAAKTTGDLFLARSLSLLSAGRPGRARQQQAAEPFDADAVDTATAELAGQIEAFITGVRRELRGLPPLPSLPDLSTRSKPPGGT